MPETNIRVVYKKPDCDPEIREIPNTLKALQDCVGGYVETVTLSTDVVIICNEEGRLMGLPHNCVFLGVDFCGPILAVGLKGEEFTSLSETNAGIVMEWLGG